MEVVLQVEDPILNYTSAFWVTTTSNSLQAVNQRAIEARARNQETDSWVNWTPAGRDGEWEEGWIGFFPLDEPWRSVDLFSEAGLWWLRHTRESEWKPGEWTRSRVNPNSIYTDALASVFLDLPKQSWPGTTNSFAVMINEANTLALEITSTYLLDGEGMGEEGMDQRGDWINPMQIPLVTGGMDRHQAESIAVASLDRLAIGSNLYGLILLSETRTPSGGARSRMRYAALLWMDPFKGVTNQELNGGSVGRYPTMKLFYSPIK